MAQNGYGPATGGHIGRIPNYGKTQVNPMGNVEPPACIQNAMMTKDKKPFTYTPGGLDLSQIRTPSMARRMARQKSFEDHEQAYHQQPQSNNGGYHPQGGPVPPPPPPPKAPVPPPPPPIVINVPKTKSPKPVAVGERPEIVIPENPIGMLRKTNSPYHWEAEQADNQRLGTVPKFVEKVPSPLTVQMPPSTFSQQQPQNYTPQGQNSFQRGPYGQSQPESPLHRPEAQYASQKSFSPSSTPPTRELLLRQDSQFNKSPQPFSGQSPLSGGSPYSPAPNKNWRQPEKRDSPASNTPQSPPYNRSQFSPSTQQFSPNVKNQSPPVNSSPIFHTLPRVVARNQEALNNNVMYNNTNEPKPQSPQNDNTAPWRTHTLNRHPKETEQPQNIYHNMQKTNQQPTYVPPWKTNEANSSTRDEALVGPWKQENKNHQYAPQWTSQDSNNNKVQDAYSPPWRSQDNRSQNSPPSKSNQDPPRYQSTMSIPVTPKKQIPQPVCNNSAPQREAVYVNQEPVYYCPESPKSIPPWVKTQKEKTKTPPPVWCQKPLEGRQSSSRELTTPPRDYNPDPEWVRKSNEMQQGAREVTSPPKYQQPVQPTWSTKPSENRKSLPRDQAPSAQGNRIIPIQMEVSSTELRDQGRLGNQQPQLRIVIGMNADPKVQGRADVPFSPPTQRIMRVLSPQLVRVDDSQAQTDLPTLNRSFQNTQDNQPKTRIIPIQIEGGNGGGNNSVYYHKFTQEGPPRQSKAFKVLQVITGTEDVDRIQDMENQNGFIDV